MRRVKLTWMLMVLMIGLLPACSTKMMHPHLVFSKTVDVGTGQRGDLIVQNGDLIKVEYQLKNSGEGPAYNVVVKAELPEKVHLRSVKVTPERDLEHPLSGSWRIGNLAPGESLTLTYQATVGEAEPGETLHLKSKVHFRDGQYQDREETASVALTVESPPQLGVRKIITPERAMPSEVLTCQTTVKNEGGSEIRDIFIEEQVPEGFQYQPGSLKTSPDVSLAFPSGTNPFVWSLSNLTAGKAVKINYEVFIPESVSPGRKPPAMARVTGRTRRGEQLQAETQSNVVSVLPAPKLVLTKHLSSTELVVDDLITCVLTLENQGAGIAKGCVIGDTMPSFFIYEEGSPISSKAEIETKSPYHWIVGDISPTETVQLTYKVSVDQTTDNAYGGYVATVQAMTETGRELQVQSNPIRFRVAKMIGNPEPHRKPPPKREDQVYIGKPQ